MRVALVRCGGRLRGTRMRECGAVGAPLCRTTPLLPGAQAQVLRTPMQLRHCLASVCGREGNRLIRHAHAGSISPHATVSVERERSRGTLTALRVFVPRAIVGHRGKNICGQEAYCSSRVSQPCVVALCPTTSCQNIRLHSGVEFQSRARRRDSTWATWLKRLACTVSQSRTGSDNLMI